MLISRSLLFAALSAAAPSAQSLIIPNLVDDVTEGILQQADPFGFDGFSMGFVSTRLLYVYDSSHFAEITRPILITSLRFRADDAAINRSGAGVTWTSVEVRLGLSRFGYEQAASTFAANYRGGEPAPSYAGPVVVQPWSGNWDGAPGDWYVTIPLATPFMFDPRAGDDFILDISNLGAAIGMTSDTFPSDEAGPNARCARVKQTGNWRDPVGFLSGQEEGLVCELGYAPVNGLFANFSADARVAGPGQVIQFTDLSVTSDPGGILNWLWDFDNDGLCDSTLQNPTWTYTNCGTEAVRLQVIDSNGIATWSDPAFIQITAPESSFEAVTWSGEPAVTVQFQDTSGGNPNAWAWDFNGDGTTDSTLQNPTWTYPSRGVHTVTLQVTNGCAVGNVFTNTVDTRRRLETGYFDLSRTGLTGFCHFFDATVRNPNGITVTRIGAHSNQSPRVPTVLEVWTKAGSWVGADTNQAAWRRVGSVSAPSGGPFGGAETIYDIPDVFLPQGNHAFAMVYASGGPRYRAARLTDPVRSNPDLELRFGIMRSSAFGGTRFEARMWNGAIEYCEGTGAGSIQPLGAGCAAAGGTTPSLATPGGAVPTIGQNFVVELTGAPASQSLSFVVMSVVNLGGLDLSVIGMPGCALYPSPMFSLPAPTDAAGRGSASLMISSNPDTVGFPIYAQAIVAAPGANALGVVVSNALQGVVGCR